MMSRKHYQDFANMIHGELVAAQKLTPVRKATAIGVVERLADQIALTCKIDNSRFRYDTFFEACGLDGFGKFPAKVIPVKKKK